MGGQGMLIAYTLPLTMDGMIVVGSLSLTTSGKGKGVAWVAFVVGLVASLAANVFAVSLDALSRMVSPSLGAAPA